MAWRFEDDAAGENGQEKEWELLELTVMGAIDS
jgi:hypothetical protein